MKKCERESILTDIFIKDIKNMEQVPRTTKSTEEEERLSRKILFAEDNEDIRESLEQNFRLEGYEVEAVENGQLLLDKLKAGEYDLIITDNDMPVLSGFKALRQIRATESLKDLPVIFLSARDDDPELLKIIKDELKASFMSKRSLSTQALLDKIKNLLEGKKQ